VKPRVAQSPFLFAFKCLKVPQRRVQAGKLATRSASRRVSSIEARGVALVTRSNPNSLRGAVGMSCNAHLGRSNVRHSPHRPHPSLPPPSNPPLPTPLLSNPVERSAAPSHRPSQSTCSALSVCACAHRMRACPPHLRAFNQRHPRALQPTLANPLTPHTLCIHTHPHHTARAIAR
jgi:hypothetical protein